MCCNSNCKGCMCVTSKVYKWLIIVGGLNWGLVGLGMLLKGTTSWNLVNMIFGSMSTVEAIVYLVVGIAAVMYALGCKCSKCKVGICSVCAVDDKPNTNSGMN